MRKLATLCLSMAVGVGSVFAGNPAMRAVGPNASSVPEGKKPIVSNPFAAGRLNSVSKTVGKSVALDGKARLPKAVRGALSPAKVGATGASVYGYLIYDADEINEVGMKEVFLDGQLTSVFGAVKSSISGADFDVAGAYMRDGKYYVLGQDTYFGMFLLGSACHVFDMEGNETEVITYGDNDPMFSYVAYNPTDDILYGFVEASDGAYYCTAPGAQPNNMTVVGAVDTHVGALTYNQVSGKLVGVTTVKNGGKVIEINTADGTATEVATLDHPSEYITGIAYSPMDNGYYYAVCSQSGCGIALLDESSYAELSYTEYDSLMEYASLLCADSRKISDSAPGETVLVNTIFANGANSGSLTYKLASVTHSGTPLMGNVDWVLEVDGVEVQRGSAAAGSEVTVKVSDLTDGLHNFRFIASLGGNPGRYCITSFYVGNDTPVAPEKVELTKQTISWTPVSTGIHEGYVNAAEVTYNVYLNDKMIEEGVKGTQCSSSINEADLMEGYVAAVEAVYAGKVSEKTYSNDVIAGQPYELPVSFEPTEKESRAFTIVDANGDAATNSAGNLSGGITYGYVSLSSDADPISCFIYTYSSANDADDWLFLPAVAFPDNTSVYEFSLNAFRSDVKYEEAFEVKLCTAPDPDAVVKTLVEETVLENTQEEMYDKITDAYFTVPSAGTYYIGVHVTSEADMFRVFMRHFSVKKAETITPASPEQASGLKAVAGADGALNAAVTFTFPTKNFSGVAYEENKALTATVKAEGCDVVTANGKAGETVTVTVPTKQGDNTISVVINDGDLHSLPATVSVYTGVEAPGTVENLTATVDATDYMLHMSWEAPAEGVNGGYVAPTGITYYLCEYKEVNGKTGWYITKAIGTDVFSYDYVLPEGTEQDLYRVGIIAENFVGMADYLTSTSNVMGEPHALPSVCNVNASLLPLPIVNYGTFELRVGNPAQKDYRDFTTPDNSQAIYTYSSTTMTNAKFALAKVSTKDTKKPTLKLDIYGGSAGFTVAVSTFGVAQTNLKTFTESEFSPKGRTTVDVELPEAFVGKDWIEIAILPTEIGRTKSFIMYGYKIYDAVPYDFGVTSIEGPAQASIASEAKYVAHITNFGTDANVVPAAVWTLTDAQGNVVAKVEVPEGTETVQPDGEVTYEIAFTPNADQVGELTLDFTLVKADDKEVNDTLSKTITVGAGLTPVVTDLHATEIGYDNVDLAWTPLAVSSEIVDSFEDVTPFELDDVTDMIGDFKRVDGDGLSVYGSQNENFKNIPGAYGPSSFLTYSQKQVDEILGASGTFRAKTGDKFLVAFCPAEPSGNPQAADDWLISPQVDAGSPFGFSVCPITYQYGAEIIEVMYSTTGDNPSDFKLLETIAVGEGQQTSASTVYEDFHFNLPADAKYFALHYVSKDVFGIMIDDITYAPAGSGYKIEGYNVYRDGALIASGVGEDGAYSDATVSENTTYTYLVVPVLEDGTLGADSNLLNITTTGVDGVVASTKAVYVKDGYIVVTGYEGESVAVVSADGKTVAVTAKASAAESYAATTGVYVVKAGKDVVKVIVK